MYIFVLLALAALLPPFGATLFVLSKIRGVPIQDIELTPYVNGLCWTVTLTVAVPVLVALDALGVIG